MRTPYFLIDEKKLKENLIILKDVAEKSGARILLAQKAYSVYQTYPLVASYLSGSTASGLYECRLAKEEFPGEVHVFSPAYRDDEFDEILEYADHIVFNSCSQVKKFAGKAKEKGKSLGLRLNPECSTQDGHAIYDPCAPGSRLGVTVGSFDPSVLPCLDGVHIHTLCEQNADALAITVAALERKFGPYLYGLKWINLGGGHHITRNDYDRGLLVGIVRRLTEKYDVQVYLEPGEAIALNAGTLETTVLDIVRNGDTEIAILDASAACHMPDVLEMPYRPPLKGSGNPGEKRYAYRLAGNTCLAGDVIGDYSFDETLTIGSRLSFEDMAIYTIVKTNTFNGMGLPSIVLLEENGNCKILKDFSYKNFKDRL